MIATGGSDEAGPGYGLLVPVKRAEVAKSRLSGLGDERRRRLVAAFALDTVEAALQGTRVRTVLAVTDDHVLAGSLRSLGADVIPDGVSDDLNASLRQAAFELARRHPRLRLAALCADLPGLVPLELDLALARACEHEGAFLPDADETGTTLVCARAVAAFDPRFGPRSRAAHRESGLVELDGTGLDTVRCDIDTPEDLRVALDLGVGRRTREVAETLP